MKAADRFLSRLAGVTDPEDKRKGIGEEFIRVFEEVAREHRAARFLVQGTLVSRRDRERLDGPRPGSRATTTSAACPSTWTSSSSNPSATCSRTRCARWAPESAVAGGDRPAATVPGTGLAVRIVGEVTRSNLEVVRAADHIVREEIRRAGLDRETWQAFCVLLAEVRSVGVMGDGRPTSIR